MEPKNSHAQVFETLVACRKNGEPCALAIVVEAQGSTPAGVGAKMLVRRRGDPVGTVGGGRIEQAVMAQSLRAISSGSASTFSIRLTPESGYVCGGRVTIYVEPVLAPPKLIIAGAGHVGQALCTAAAFCGFCVTAADDRAEYAAKERLPEASDVITVPFDILFKSVPVDENTFIVCATRGHEHDYGVVLNALKTPAPYIGLLGSRKKKARFFENLIADGIAEDQLVRVHTPVGLDIGAVTPTEIALSIAAQLVQKRRKHVHDSGCRAAGSRQINTDERN